MKQLGDYLVSSVCTAFTGSGLGPRVGTRVVAVEPFLRALQPLVQTAEFHDGVAAIDCPPEMFAYVTSGDGVIPQSPRAQDFVLVEWRGEVERFLRREHALPVQNLTVLLFTAAAYRTDPDKDQIDPLTGTLTWDAQNQREEIAWLRNRNIEDERLVIVGVFASGLAERPPLPRRALLHNIAGGNAAYLPKTTPSEHGIVDAATGASTPDADAWIEAMIHDVAMLHNWIAHAKTTERWECHFAVVADEGGE